MNKKKIIIISSIVILLVAIIVMMMFTKLGTEIRGYISHRILTPKEMVQIQHQEHIKITYTYGWNNEGFNIDVTNEELIDFIIENISNKKLKNYSGEIGLAIMGEYTVDLGNGISFKFDGYEEDGFVMFQNSDKKFLTKINPEILKKVVEIVDVKLTENIQIFKTDKITIWEKSEKCVAGRQIEEKTAIEYILELCKKIQIKEINYEPSIVTPNYEIAFNDNVKLLIYNKEQKGWLLKDGILSEAYGLNIFDTIIENSFDNVVEREKMFKTDKIKIMSPNKTVEVMDKNVIEKITTNLMYSTIGEPTWLATYDITEEYNSGIKVQLNDCEFLIPESKNIGNRYIVSKDRKIKLCYPLQSIEDDIYGILGIKKEEASGLVSIAVSKDIPKVTPPKDNTIGGEEIKEERTLSKVSMKIKEGTLTKTSATIVITDTNESPYGYETWYRIDKKLNGQWKELQTISPVYWTEQAFIVNKDGILELKENWKDIYGELEKGEYRLVKRHYENGYNYFWVEFSI